MDEHNAQSIDVRTIKSSEFKSKCLKLMDEVADSGVEMVITKKGRPVSRLVPYRGQEPGMFGRDRGKIRSPRHIGLPHGFSTRIVAGYDPSGQRKRKSILRAVHRRSLPE